MTGSSVTAKGHGACVTRCARPSRRTRPWAARRPWRLHSSCACSTGSGSNASSGPPLRTCSGSPTSPTCARGRGGSISPLSRTPTAVDRGLVDGRPHALRARRRRSDDGLRPASTSARVIHHFDQGGQYVSQEGAGVPPNPRPTRRDLIDEIFEYIEAFHNRRRRHCTLGCAHRSSSRKDLAARRCQTPRRHNNFNSLPTTTRTP